MAKIPDTDWKAWNASEAMGAVTRIFVRLLWALLIGVSAVCAAAEGSLADTRVALVIGNGAYQNAPRLPNPTNDAAGVAAALKRAGFDTIVATDLTKAGMDEATIRFARAARTADVAMFYYSGHALQFAGVNYLLPIDTDLNDETDLRRMIRVDDVVADLAKAKNLRILVLDSCRNNPFADQLKRSIGASRAVPLQRGLAKIDSPEGMIVAYSTQAGRTAEDGGGDNSPYTTAFLKHIDEKEEIGSIFRRVSADVYETTKHEQLPELSLSLIGEFYLHGKIEVTVKPEDTAPRDFEAAERVDSVTAWDAFLQQHPNGFYATLAKERQSRAAAKIAALPPNLPPVAAAPPAQTAPDPATEAVRSFADALVQIPNLQKVASTQAPGGAVAAAPPSAGGYGFVVDPSGLVVANWHLIGDAKDIPVVLRNGERLNAEIVGKDRRTDLVLLRVKPDRPLKAVRWATGSTRIAVGQKVAAFIYPPTSQDSLKIGKIQVLNPDRGFLETDIGSGADPDRSGPLFNLDGEVIGVNVPSALFGSGSTNGIAIVATAANTIITELKDKGFVSRGWVGLQVQPVTADVAEALGLKKAEGALVAEPQANGPAAKAGIESGDVITTVNGATVKDGRDLASVIGGTAPGTTVKLNVFHKGEDKVVSLTLGQLPELPEAKAGNDSDDKGHIVVHGTAVPGLGLSVAPASTIAGAGKEGVVVTNVDPKSAAEERGLKEGDVILDVSGKSVANAGDVGQAVNAARTGNKGSVLMRVRNSGGSLRFVGVPVAKG